MNLKSLRKCKKMQTLVGSSPLEQQPNGKVEIVTQTDLSLVHISDQLSSYLSGLSIDNNCSQAPFYTSQMLFITY
ncbi:unnamed protein product [Thelazia callipaeda]|uniref:Ovule protein n=1 Tax=Thelazia callipaeda TaxID=103827 RepID=A0A0N5CYU7_THECL|nr:unnamed protein product [Thelazia callipaeda]